MIGAIIGDIIGSTYEGKGIKVGNKNWDLFTQYSICTDDTIMTLAVGQALINVYNIKDNETIQKELIKQMQAFGKIYPYSRYGKNFAKWLRTENPEPYNSYGNGAGMRVSSVAWLYDDIETINKYAEITASISHNHVEGIKGACAIASAIYLAKQKKSKKEISNYIQRRFGYALNPIKDIVEKNKNSNKSCQVTVPIAIQIFLESENFEDTMRNALFVGGDTDTIACMAGSIAETYYEIPNNMLDFAFSRMDDTLKKTLKNILLKIEEKNNLNRNLEKILEKLKKENY